MNKKSLKINIYFPKNINQYVEINNLLDNTIERICSTIS